MMPFKEGFQQHLGRERKSWYALFIMAVVAVALVAAWVTWPRSSPKAAEIPENLGGLSLLRLETGPAAMESVGGMHTGSFALQDAWIATYQGGAAVWVGDAQSEAEAEQLVQAMASAIGRGGSPFSSPSQRTVNKKPMFTTSDGQQQHFFYRTGKRVVWIVVPARDGMRFVQEVSTFLG